MHCPYKHDKSEKSNVQCCFFMNGGCKRSFCQYRHDNPNTILTKRNSSKSIIKQLCRKPNTSLTVSNWSTACGGTSFFVAIPNFI